jgi:hypothetical protein
MEKLDKFVVIDILKHMTFDEIEKFAQIKNKFYKTAAKDAIEVKLTTYRQLPARLCAKLILIQKFSEQHAETIVRILSSIKDGMVLALVQTQEHVHGYLSFSQALRDHIREHTDDEGVKSALSRNMEYVELAFAFLKRDKLLDILRKYNFALYVEGLIQYNLEFTKTNDFLSEKYRGVPVWYLKLTDRL